MACKIWTAQSYIAVFFCISVNRLGNFCLLIATQWIYSVQIISTSKCTAQNMFAIDWWWFSMQAISHIYCAHSIQMCALWNQYLFARTRVYAWCVIARCKSVNIARMRKWNVSSSQPRMCTRTRLWDVRFHILCTYTHHSAHAICGVRMFCACSVRTFYARDSVTMIFINYVIIWYVRVWVWSVCVQCKSQSSNQIYERFPLTHQAYFKTYHVKIYNIDAIIVKIIYFVNMQNGQTVWNPRLKASG